MLYDPVEKAKEKELVALPKINVERIPAHQQRRQFATNQRLFDRWMQFKQFVLLKNWRKRGEDGQEKGLLSLLFFW
jgi:hypothetical protein